MDALGTDYSMKATTSLLMATRGEHHPTERADLFGKRFVACVESEEGRRLAESLVKDLTGGDRVRARRMKEDFWEFEPTHKIILATNHRPDIRGTDHAIWRRIRLVPFDVIVSDAEQDKALPEKLRAELPGILAWCIQGCLDWQRNNGLGEPEEVTEATADYRDEQDTIGAFFRQHCILGPAFKSRARDLYARYKKHCEESGEFTLKQKRFGASLKERGLEKYTNNGVWYSGIGLTTEVTE